MLNVNDTILLEEDLAISDDNVSTRPNSPGYDIHYEIDSSDSNDDSSDTTTYETQGNEDTSNTTAATAEEIPPTMNNHIEYKSDNGQSPPKGTQEDHNDEKPGQRTFRMRTTTTSTTRTTTSDCYIQ